MSISRAFAVLACVLLGACSRSDNGADSSPAVSGSGWVGSWAAAPYGPYPIGPISSVAPVDPLGLTTLSLFPDKQSHNQSFRVVVHPTLGGQRIRVRLSNLMGDRAITFTDVQVARRLAGPAVDPGSTVQVRFGGQPEGIAAPGAELVSDPLDFSFERGADLAVSFHVPGDSGPLTWHSVSLNINYVGLPGMNVASEPTGASMLAQPTLGWFFVSGIDVEALDSPGSIVTIGDSITDGTYQVPETNTRWPDLLSQRLAGAGIAMGVLNQGINSNTVVASAISEGQEWKGPAAEDRFERDVLQRPGVRSVVIFEGTNDLTSGIKADEIYAGIRRMVDRAHAAGLCVVLGTIMPRSDVLFGWNRATMEADRELLNQMIRATPGIEGIADFDAVMGNPLEPTLPNYLYYAPDFLHPTSIGFYIMASAVPIEALVPPPQGNCSR